MRDRVKAVRAMKRRVVRSDMVMVWWLAMVVVMVV